jgi:hypothetical protein
MGTEEMRQQGQFAEFVAQSIAEIATEGVDTWIERYAAPGYVWDLQPMGLGYYVGADAFRDFYEEWTAAYADWFIEVDELRALSGEVVVARLRQGGRPHGSDQSVELRYGAASVWRDGRCESTVNYPTFEEALAAAQELMRGGG